MSALLPSACQRKFTELEMYYCFGCYLNNTNYINEQNKTIKLCKNFAERLWGGLGSNFENVLFIS